MSTPVGYDQQYCPIARGLDLLGDRWTLLVVRELAVGPQRFSDLQRNLPGIAATVLSDRLRTMTHDGVVDVVPSDRPGGRGRYALGPQGRRALPVLASLARFGMPLLEPPTDETVLRPAVVVRAAVLAFHDPVAAAGIDERYELRIDDEVVVIDAQARVVDGSDADLVVTTSAATWMFIRRTRAALDDLIADGEVTCTGSKQARRHFTAAYRLDDATASRR